MAMGSMDSISKYMLLNYAAAMSLALLRLWRIKMEVRENASTSIQRTRVGWWPGAVPLNPIVCFVNANKVHFQ